MKTLLTVLLCLCVPLMGADKKHLTKEESTKVIEAVIRKEIGKPTGELTKADLEKVALVDFCTSLGRAELAK